MFGCGGVIAPWRDAGALGELGGAGEGEVGGAGCSLGLGVGESPALGDASAVLANSHALRLRSEGVGVNEESGCAGVAGAMRAMRCGNACALQ